MLSGPLTWLFIKIIGARLVVVIGCLLIGYGAFLQINITVDLFFKIFLFSTIKGLGAQFLWIGNQYICLASIPLKSKECFSNV